MSVKAKIMRAAKYGNIATIKLYTNHSIDFNFQNSYGCTPLHYAALFGNIEIVKLMLDGGADINVKDKEGHTPLFNAFIQNHIEVFHYFLKMGANINSKDIIIELIKCKRCLRECKGTILHYASVNCDLDSIQLLIDNGANINYLNTNNKPPIFLACLENRVNVVKFFLDNGVNPNIRENDITLLSLARHTYGAGYRRELATSLEMMKLLILDYGCVDNVVKQEYETINQIQYKTKIKHNNILENNAIHLFFKQAEITKKFEEWRPWNHHDFPSTYRNAMKTMALLAKINKRSD